MYLPCRCHYTVPVTKKGHRRRYLKVRKVLLKKAMDTALQDKRPKKLFNSVKNTT